MTLFTYCIQKITLKKKKIVNKILNAYLLNYVS